MIQHIPYDNLGHAQHDWLDARHHFSFAEYYDPSRMGFGTLRVVNDDRIQPHTGFGTHPHRDMEIITFVRQGAISHEDSLGNKGKTQAGDVQVMSAGTGVFHSEYNDEEEVTRLYQIWITPNQKSIAPTWNSAKFPKEPVTDSLHLLVSGDGSAPLQICQDAFIYGGVLLKETEIRHPIHHQAYILISKGKVQIEDILAQEGDAIQITDQQKCIIKAITQAEVIVIDVP
jgi:redox-sensitive bicupin YhaK (pirin superfamily)